MYICLSVYNMYIYLFGHIQNNQPSVTLQKLKNHKFLFYLKNKEASYEDFFCP